jgi:hypothetical protein
MCRGLALAARHTNHISTSCLSKGKAALYNLINMLSIGTSFTMYSALERVLSTAELVEHVMLFLQLDSFLSARDVCWLWRELIMRSKRFQQIKSEPYIGVRIRLPSKCSVDQDEPSTLEADLTLYYDKPITIHKTWGAAPFPRKTFFKFEAESDPPASKSFRRIWWGSKFHCRPHHFSLERAHYWETLYPGIPLSLSWKFQQRQHSGPRRSLGIW